MYLTGIVCKFCESECLRNFSSMLEPWQVGPIMRHSPTNLTAEWFNMILASFRHFFRQAKPTHAANFGDVPRTECCRNCGWNWSFWLLTNDYRYYSFVENTKETNHGPPPVWCVFCPIFGSGLPNKARSKEHIWRRKTTKTHRQP